MQLKISSLRDFYLLKISSRGIIWKMKNNILVLIAIWGKIKIMVTDKKDS